MKSNAITIGKTYQAKVSDRVVPVRLDREHPSGGGWMATNLATGKQVRIKSARRLRGEVKSPDDLAGPNDADTAATAATDATVANQPSDEATETPVATVANTGDHSTAQANGRITSALSATDKQRRAAIREIDDRLASLPQSETDDEEDDDTPIEAAAETNHTTKRRLSCIDAAAQVLQAHDGAMRVREIIAEMTSQGLWSSPNGKTPAASLYAAIIREIADKGDEARFVKVDRGLFAARKAG